MAQFKPLLGLQCVLLYFADVGQVCICFAACVIRELRVSFAGYIVNTCVVVFSYVYMFILPATVAVRSEV